MPLLDKHRVTLEKRMGVCHTRCVTLYVNNGGKHTDDDLDRVGSPPDFGKSLGVCWETWLMMTTLIVECMKRFEYIARSYKDIVLFL